MVVRVFMEPGVYSATTLASIAAISSPKFRDEMAKLGIEPLRESDNGKRKYASYGESAYAWATARRSELVAKHQAKRAALEAKRQAVSERIAAAQKQAEQLKLDFAGHKVLDAQQKEEDKRKLRIINPKAPFTSDAQALMKQNRELIDLMRGNNEAINNAANRLVAAINALVSAWEGKK